MMNSVRMSADNELLESQLSELMAMIEPRDCKDQVSISPLERLLRTKPLWFLPEVTREDSTKLLHNKKPGNFIIRGSRQPNTLAISVKIGTSHEVQHFIILKTERKVSLEDSDIKFDNLISLAFHYSCTCDELPEKLCLPAVLGGASLQSLASLSLLGTSFWTYPMARSDRASLFLMDNQDLTHSSLPTQSHNQDYSRPSGQESCDQSNTENDKVIKTPPIAPRKFSLGTNSPPPAVKVKSRRNSDSVPFITAPARVPPMSRNSIANMPSAKKSDSEGWVSSPVFVNSRHRKVSVFDGNLVSVNEIHEDDNNGDNEVLYEDISEQHLSPGNDNSKILHDEDGDYAFPVDAVTEDNIYDNPTYPTTSTAPGNVINIITQRLPGTNIGHGVDTDLRSSSHQPGLSKRKLSLGVILRKISTGSLNGVARKTSLQERRLSNAFAKLITLPTFVKNTLGESYQVDSSSWEFLNKDADHQCWEDDKTDKRRLNKDTKHPSKDSVYESEYDSSSTLESSSSDKRSFSASNMLGTRL